MTDATEFLTNHEPGGLRIALAWLYSTLRRLDSEPGAEKADAVEDEQDCDPRTMWYDRMEDHF